MSEPNSVRKIKTLAVEALDEIGVNPAAIVAAGGSPDVVTRVLDYVPASAAPNNTIGFVVLDATDNAVLPSANAESCTLPVGEHGKRVIVKNIAQAYTLQVFPSVGEDLGQGAGVSETLQPGIARTYIYLTNVGPAKWHDYNFLMQSTNSYNSGLTAFGKQSLTSNADEALAEITSSYVNVNTQPSPNNRVRLPNFETVAPSGIWGDIVVENGSQTDSLAVYPASGYEIIDSSGDTYGLPDAPFTIPPGEIWTFRARNGSGTYYLLNSNFEGTAVNGLSASGTDYAGALNSTIVTQIARFDTVTPASAEGAVLPNAKKGRRVFIFNDTANTLTVYGNTSVSNTVEGGASTTLTTGVKQWFVALSDTAWIKES